MIKFLPLLLLSSFALAQFQPQVSGTHASLRGLSVVDSNVVWASGSGGACLRTTDGGRTWTAATVTGAESLDFRGVKAFDVNTAILMSAGPAEEGKAKIFKTTDGGKHWREVYSTNVTGVFLDAIAFWDKQHGIVISDPVEGRFIILTTSDAGETWTGVPPSKIPAALPKEGAFAASNSALTVQGNNKVWFGTGGAGTGRVFYSRDRGQSWSVVATPVKADNPASGIFSLAFRDAKHGVAVGGDYQHATESTSNIAITSDGGKTWTAASTSPPLYLSSVAYSPRNAPKNIFAVGSGGSALSWDGGMNWEKVGRDGFNAVGFTPFGFAWAVGADGRIAQFFGKVT